MTEGGRKRRVLVALDRSPQGRAAIERATIVAARLRAELVGVYVEDEELVRLSGSPFACEVRSLGGAVQALNLESMRRELQAEAALARRDLERGARAQQLQTRFVIRRGGVTAEILAACTEADYVVIGRSRKAARRRHVGRTARALARAAKRPIWLIQSGNVNAEALVLVLDASADVDGVIAACARISDPAAHWVVAVLGSGNTEEANEIRARAARALAREARNADFVDIAVLDAAELGFLVARLEGAALALPMPSDPVAADRAALVAESLPCNVLIIPPAALAGGAAES